MPKLNSNVSHKGKIMKKLFISIILLFCATSIYSQVENDRTLTSSYQDNNIIYSLSVKIRPYKRTDTVEAKLYIKNIGNIPLYIEKTQNDSALTLTDRNYSNEIFWYKILGELDYVPIFTHYSYDLYLTEVKPGEEKSYRLIVPLSLAKDLKGQVPNYKAIHTRDFGERVGLEIDCGYLPKVGIKPEYDSFQGYIPKGNLSSPILSNDGRYDYSSQEKIAWLDYNIKQFTLGPIYVGLERN